jgi:hypothetical protein
MYIYTIELIRMIEVPQELFAPGSFNNFSWEGRLFLLISGQTGVLDAGHEVIMQRENSGQQSVPSYPKLTKGKEWWLQYQCRQPCMVQIK